MKRRKQVYLLCLAGVMCLYFYFYDWMFRIVNGNTSKVVSQHIARGSAYSRFGLDNIADTAWHPQKLDIQAFTKQPENFKQHAGLCTSGKHGCDLRHTRLLNESDIPHPSQQIPFGDKLFHNLKGHEESTTRPNSSSTRGASSLGSSSSSYSIIHLVFNCDRNSFLPWQARIGFEILSHAKFLRYFINMTSVIIPRINNPCYDCHYSIAINRTVLPRLCTQCESQVHTSSVTLIIPMSDTQVMWTKLAMHAQRWNGPISVGLLLSTNDSLAFQSREDDIVKHLTNRIKDYNLSAISRVCFHAVLQLENPFSYFSINTLRNVAMYYSMTDWVLNLEADLLTPENLGQSLMKELGYYSGKSEKIVFVLPLFQLHNITLNSTKFPNSKQELLDMWTQGRVQPMGSLRPAHRSTNEEKFKQVTNIYKITYRVNYEPYYVMNRSMTPYYPEELLYGYKDKSIHAQLLDRMGFHFVGFGQHFILHPEHTHHTLNRSAHLYKCGDIQYLRILDHFKKVPRR